MDSGERTDGLRFLIRGRDAKYTDASDAVFTAAGTRIITTPGQTPPVRAWLSVPIGVVTLVERFPEGEVATESWYRQMVDHVKAEIEAFRRESLAVRLYR